MSTPPTDEITSKEALALLELADPSTISRYVQIGKLTPSRKLPGKTGAFLFWRHDILRLADEQRSKAAAS